MKANTAIGVGLFFLASFSLLYWTLHTPVVEFYTGGIVIALFIAGLFYSFGNAIRQGKKLEHRNAAPLPGGGEKQAPIVEPKPQQQSMQKEEAQGQQVSH